MAEFDDDRPDFDAVFRDLPPEGSRGRGRRGPREPDTDFDFDLDDTEGTGEFRRPRASSTPPPRASAPQEELPTEPPPRSRRTARPPRASGSRPRGGGRPPRSRGGGGTRGGGSALRQQPGRLLAMIVAAIVLILVILFVVRDCQKSQLKDSYTQYINGVAQIVTTSASQGAELRKVLNNPKGDRPPQLKAKISAIAKEARALVDQADELDPPGALSSAQRSLVAGVLEYRVTGLTTLAADLPTLLQSSNEQTKASGIAEKMKRFLASDVIYADSFFGPAGEAFKKDDITDLKVPPLQPFLPNAALASPEGAKSLIPALERRGAAATGSGDTSSATGNLRGMSLESTVAIPSDTRLTPGETASVQSTEALKWQVTVKNGGDFDESDVIVRATFFYPANPNDTEEREVAIASIAPDESTTVEIPGPTSEKVVFGEQGTLRIEVVPVPGETKTDNNSAEYPVKITI